MSGGLTTGGVDSGIALQAGKGQGEANNPLQQIGQFANIQNALNQNKLFPGQAALQQQQVQSGQVGLAQKINQAGYQALTPLLSGTINHDNLTTALGSVESNLGLPTQGILADIMKTAPSGDGPEFDAKVRGLIAARSQTAPESAVGMVTPGVGPQIDNGPVIALTTKGAPGSQTPGQLANAGAITKGFAPQIYNDGREGLPLINGQSNGTVLTNHPAPGRVDTGDIVGLGVEGNAGARAGISPTDLAKQVNRPASAQEAQALGIPPGTPLMTTQLATLQQEGFPLGGIGGGQGGMGGVTGHAGPVSPTNPPRLNQAAGSGVVQAGLAPGYEHGVNLQTDSWNDANRRAQNYAQDMYPLQAAQQALESAPTGKGSAAVHNFSSYVNTFAPEWVQKGLSFISPTMTPDELTSYDLVKKYFAQGTLGAPGALRSNAGQAEAQAATPNPEITKAAAQIVNKGMIGLRRMEQDGITSFNNSGQPQSDYNKFMTNFANQADPHVYTFDQMTPQERQQTLAKMTKPGQREQFIQQVTNAEKNGILTAPGGQ